MAITTVRMQHAKETKGAHQYREVDENNKTLEMVDAHIGQLYVRKTALNGSQAPNVIKVTIDVE